MHRPDYNRRMQSAHGMIGRPLRWIGTTLVVMFLASSARVPAQTSAFPCELVDFVPSKVNPIFTGGGKGKWDERIRERGWIMRDGGIYKMWYTGYTGTPGEILKLGY